MPRPGLEVQRQSPPASRNSPLATTSFDSKYHQRGLIAPSDIVVKLAHINSSRKRATSQSPKTRSFPPKASSTPPLPRSSLTPAAFYPSQPHPSIARSNLSSVNNSFQIQTSTNIHKKLDLHQLISSMKKEAKMKGLSK